MDGPPVMPGDRIELESAWLSEFRVREGHTGTVEDLHTIFLGTQMGYGSDPEPHPLAIEYWHVVVDWDDRDGYPEMDLILPRDVIRFLE